MIRQNLRAPQSPDDPDVYTRLPRHVERQRPSPRMPHAGSPVRRRCGGALVVATMTAGHAKIGVGLGRREDCETGN